MGERTGTPNSTGIWIGFFAIAAWLHAGNVFANPGEAARAGRCEQASAARSGAQLAIVEDEPGSCNPPCRNGYLCRAGKCVTLCNPPCAAGEHCVRGECEPIPRVGEPARMHYLALLGGGRLGINGIAESTGELRVEFGGPYVSYQVGPSFAKGLAAIRSALVGHHAFQLIQTAPLFLVPMLQFGYTFSWIDLDEARHQDFFVTPGLRVRYDVLRRLALFADLIEVEVNFLRLRSSAKEDVHRVSGVPVQWGIHAGFAFLY